MIRRAVAGLAGDDRSRIIERTRRRAGALLTQHADDYVALAEHLHELVDPTWDDPENDPARSQTVAGEAVHEFLEERGIRANRRR